MPWNESPQFQVVALGFWRRITTLLEILKVSRLNIPCQQQVTGGEWYSKWNWLIFLVQYREQCNEIWCRALYWGNGLISTNFVYCKITAYLTPAIPSPPAARWTRAHVDNTAYTKQNGMFPKISSMQEGNRIRINCMKISGPFRRLTICSNSTISSTWIVVFVLRSFLCKYCIILYLM